VQQDAGVSGRPQRQDEVQQISRIAKGELDIAERWHTGEEMGVPEGKIPGGQLAEGELPLADELTIEVRSPCSEDKPLTPKQGSARQEHDIERRNSGKKKALGAR
jgi:hypothetical protein